MSTHPSQWQPDEPEHPCFYCDRPAAGVIAGIPATLHPDQVAVVCSECYQLILDVEGDIRFLDFCELWIAKDGSLIPETSEQE